MRRFWNWLDPEPDTSDPDADGVRVLRINGQIANESWFDDDITPPSSPANSTPAPAR